MGRAAGPRPAARRGRHGLRGERRRDRRLRHRRRGAGGGRGPPACAAGRRDRRARGRPRAARRGPRPAAARHRPARPDARLGGGRRRAAGRALRCTTSASTGCATSRRPSACSRSARPATSRCARWTPRRTTCRATRRRFVGRDAELAELHGRLAQARLITITGPGGSGKTRLAAQLAADEASRRPDGAWWVELGDIADPGQVAESVAAALGVLVDPAQGTVGLAACAARLPPPAALPGQLRARARRRRRRRRRAVRGLPGGRDRRHQPGAARAHGRAGVAAAAAARPRGARAVRRARGARAARPRARRGGRRRHRLDVHAAGRVAARARAGRRVAAHAHPAPDRGRPRRPLRAARAQPARRRPAPREPARLDGVEPQPARRDRPRRVPPARGVPGGLRSGGGARGVRRGRRRARRPRPPRRQVAAWWPTARATGCRRRSASTPPTGCAPRASAARPPTGCWRTCSPACATRRRCATPTRTAGAPRSPPSTTTCAPRSSMGSTPRTPSPRARCVAELPWLWQMHRQGREGLGFLRRAIARSPDDRSPSRRGC